MLIKCPECGREVSSQAKACIHCGYPMQQVPTAQKSIPAVPSVKRAPVKRCSKCGAVFPADDEACPTCGKSGGKVIDEQSVSKPVADKPAPTIKCPTCGSTDVERVSVIAKAVNVWAFGLFGNKRNKQFKCKACDYMW